MGLKAGRVGIHPSQVDPITGMLINGPTPGSISFEDLSDAQISNPEVGQTLQYNGTGWENVFASISPVTPSTLASLQDVAISSAQNKQILQYDSTAAKWENEDLPSIPSKTSDLQNDSGFITISSVPTTITALQDVQITDPEDGDYLTYDSENSKWVNSGVAPGPTYTDITVTLYSAVEDTISFTDAAGISHSEVFASGQSSKSVTFKINPLGSTPITFTSAVAKNPNSLSDDYTKTISVTSATTEIKVMPDNSVYWWGYVGGDFEECNSANGWSYEKPFLTPTYNKRDILLSTGNNACGVSTKTAMSGSFTAILTGTNASGNVYGYWNGETSKSLQEADQISITSGTITKYTKTVSNKYPVLFAVNNRAFTVHALWYE